MAVHHAKTDKKSAASNKLSGSIKAAVTRKKKTKK